MAIQVRRGLRADFNPSKLLPGEWAVSIDSDTDNQIVWMCFAPNIVKRMGTYEDFQKQIEEITESIKEDFINSVKEEVSEYVAAIEQAKTEVERLAEEVSQSKADVITIQTDIEQTYLPMIAQYVLDAEQSKNLASGYANNSLESAELSSSYAEQSQASAVASSNSSVLAKSYTHGGTGTREGEDSDNAKYYMEQAKAVVGGDYVSRSEVGKTVASLIDGKVPTEQLPEDLGTKDYGELENKPSINGHVLTGNHSTSDLGLFSGNYDDLENRPTIPPAYELPIATTSELGGVKPDGETITVDENGVISFVGGGGGSSSDWELIGSVTGAWETVSIPNGYKDIKVRISYSGGLYNGVLDLNNFIIYEDTTKSKSFYVGAKESMRFDIFVYGKALSYGHVYYENADVSSNATMQVYGKR